MLAPFETVVGMDADVKRTWMYLQRVSKGANTARPGLVKKPTMPGFKSKNLVTVTEK